MHPGCLKYFSEIEKIDEFRIKCCEPKERQPNPETESDSAEDTSFETVVDMNEALNSSEKVISDLTKENEILSKENSLLRKLIAEMEDKNNLLLFKISVLERDTTQKVCSDSSHLRITKRITNKPELKSLSGNAQKKSPDATLPPEDVKAGSTTPCRLVNKSAVNRNINISNSANLVHSINEKDANVDLGRPRYVRGTRQTTGRQNCFSSSKQRVWLHIGKVEVGTTPDMILDHLKDQFPERKFVVEALPVKPEATSISFKVGGDRDLVEDLYSGDNWPSGITVRRFSFFPRSRTMKESK